MLEIGALCSICLALGAVSGYAFAEARERRLDIDLLPDYDPNTRINGNVPAEKMEIYGIELYKLQ